MKCVILYAIFRKFIKYVYIKLKCTISRFHEQYKQQHGIYFHYLALYEHVALANHGRRLQGQLARSSLAYDVAAITQSGVAAGTIHGHSAAVVARLICCRKRHFILT